MNWARELNQKLSQKPEASRAPANPAALFCICIYQLVSRACAH